MTNSMVVEAETIKKALHLALEKLSTTKYKVEVDILREEKKGLFGMESARSAKIRVRLKT